MIRESGRLTDKTPARILGIYSNCAGNPACFHILGFAPTTNFRYRQSRLRKLSATRSLWRSVAENTRLIARTQRALHDRATQVWEFMGQIRRTYIGFYTMAYFAESLLA